MTRQFHLLTFGIAVPILVAAHITSFAAHAGTVVYVADVEQLYDVVNHGNEGATVVLYPGIYPLSSTDPTGMDRPNGGRLELKKDMSLYGVAGDRTAVVIDARALPRASFSAPFGRTGPIRIGRGSNTIEWLTVLGWEAAAAGIATELDGMPSTRIRVAHVVSSGTSRGVDVRNVGLTMEGRRIDAEIVDNDFLGPEVLEPGTMSEGIRVVNFVGANRGVIVATLRANRTHGFQIGCIVANNRSSNAAVQVRSSGDEFSANGLGCVIAGGLSQAATGVADSNTTAFEAFGSKFVDNTADLGFEPGGIRVAGGLSTMLTNVTSGNTVSVSLSGSQVSGNEQVVPRAVDFEAFGAIQTALAGLAGTDNRVTITLRGISAQTEVVAVDSLVEDPSGSNTVTVIRSPDAR
ncbi:MAG TPA: hypothetical protein VD833_19475 [Vicinamibacterales bacterium]|nr:hypothetical protein [Vicinamibacterales bacterium]